MTDYTAHSPQLGCKWNECHGDPDTACPFGKDATTSTNVPVYRWDLAADLKLTEGQARRHKLMHPKRGYPDLFIAKACTLQDVDGLFHHYNGLFIELKKEAEKLTKKDGTWRTPHIAEQSAMIDRLQQAGYRAQFAVGELEATQVIANYLG